MVAIEEQEEARTFYIASSIGNVEQVQHYIKTITEHTDYWNSPYVCAHDWTQAVLSDKADSSERKKALWEELNAIEDCSLVIVLRPIGRNSHIEIGYAIANRVPVVMIGEKDTTCLGYEAVELAKDLDELIEGLELDSWV